MLRLEIARDRRHLEQFQEALRQSLKCKALGLASLQLQRPIARHESRVLWLSEADASTQFFRSYDNSGLIHFYGKQSRYDFNPSMN
jgi:hypothetical protein